MLSIGTVLIPQLLMFFVIYKAWSYFRITGRGYFDPPLTSGQQISKPLSVRRPLR